MLTTVVWMWTAEFTVIVFGMHIVYGDDCTAPAARAATTTATDNATAATQKITSIITTQWAWIIICKSVTMSCLESADRLRHQTAKIQQITKQKKSQTKPNQNKKYQVFSWNARPLFLLFICIHETSSFAHKYLRSSIANCVYCTPSCVCVCVVYNS